MPVPSKTTEKVRGVFEKVPGSGAWWIQYFDSEGRRRREKVGSKGAARKLVDIRRAESHQNKKLPANLREKALTFGSLIDAALEHSRAQNGKRSTKELELKYETLRPVFGARPAAGINKQEIVRWIETVASEREWLPATKNRWQAAFSLAFRVGIENDRIDKNPASRIRRATEDNGRIRFLSDDEELQLRTAIFEQTPEHVDAFELSLHSGMRSSEQFSLQWEQVDWQRSIVTLYRTKNNRPRHLPLNTIALRALRNLRKRCDQINPQSPWVFISGSGEKLRGHRDWFEPALRSSGIANYSWHCNRHTFASRLVSAGVDLRTVGELLGHRTPAMTWRYAHLAPDHQQGAVDRLVTRAEKTATKSATGRKAVKHKRTQKPSK